ncbi:MAG TPA: TonB-dependent receptor [Terriglobia bacterium]|nr:TonB-dependent receptor [Terriglobia bacterium]
MSKVGSITKHAALITALVASFAAMVSAQDNSDDLTTISLENLMNVKVSTVTRHLEELRNTPAAVYVITQEDIRRSGATDIAELLRTVPGVDIAQINPGTWALSVRGFANEYATKLMVLVDGRSVYDPTFSGVYWRLQNLVLEDIERIEVIRGPGATMWGANAVNGVISITTKKAADTQGSLFVADAGSNRPGEGSLRFGGAIGKNAFYRVFGRQTTRSNSSTISGADGGGSWNQTDAGLRLDWSLSTADSVTFEAGSYRGVSDSRQNVLTSLSPVTYQRAGITSHAGGHVQVQWSRSLGDNSNLKFQFYYDRRHLGGWGGKDLQILDFDLQHNFKIDARHNVMWGAGRRETSDTFPYTLAFSLTPNSKRYGLWSAFVQDEITVVPDKLQLTAGTKIERSTFTGYNIQPMIRLSWTPTARQSAWLSVSHAVRTANRVERGMHVNLSAFPLGDATGILALFGQENTRSEGLVAYEAGYRYQANRKLWLDLTTFENIYDHASSVEVGRTFLETQANPPLLYQPLFFGNDVKGVTRGIELATNYKVNSLLSFKGGYSVFHSHLHSNGNPAVFSSDGAPRTSAANQVYVGSFLTLPKSFEISGHSYFVGSRPAYKVPGYTRVDLNLAWKRIENIELAVVGQNLLGSHIEFGDLATPANAINRSIYGKITWKF